MDATRVANSVALRGGFDSRTFRLVTNETAAQMRAVADMKPHPMRDRLLQGRAFLCPLCAFVLPMDWDNHLFPCILRNVAAVHLGA